VPGYVRRMEQLFVAGSDLVAGGEPLDVPRRRQSSPGAYSERPKGVLPQARHLLHRRGVGGQEPERRAPPKLPPIRRLDLHPSRPRHLLRVKLFNTMRAPEELG